VILNVIATLLVVIGLYLIVSSTVGVYGSILFLLGMAIFFRRNKLYEK